MSGDIDRAAITQRLRDLITVRGGPAEVARLCDIALPTVETWIAGRGLPGSVNLAKLARGCAISAHWILFGKERAR